MNRQDLVSSIAEGFHHIRRHVVHHSQQGNQSSKNMPTPAQLAVLYLLAHSEVNNTKQIAEHLCMSPSAITQLVDGLAREKILERKEDVKDRRKIILTLTSLGKKKLILAQKKHLKVFENMFKFLSDRELIQIESLQKKIIEHLK